MIDLATDFDYNGYVILRQQFDNQDLDPVREAIAAQVERMSQQYQAQGQIDQTFDDAPFDRRWAHIAAAASQTSDAPLPWIWGGAELLDKAVYELYTDERLTAPAAALLGPELMANGDFWVRPKVPGHGGTTLEWHQDSFYYGGQSDPGRLVILSAWIPLVDTDADNGCMRIIPGSHRHGAVPAHRTEAGQMAPDHDVARYGEAIDLPMRAGDVLLFHNLTLHASGHNRTADQVRWSIDLRYMRANQGFGWHHMGDDFNRRFPCFVARSDQPGQVGSWEEWQARWAAVDA